PECSSDEDCSQSSNCLEPTCEQPGLCDADCTYSPITECKNNDGCCPTGCSGSDNDCSAACETDENCDDDNPCTNDTCNDGDCQYTHIAENTPCSGGICCNGICNTTICEQNSDCDDGNACKKNFTCVSPGNCSATCNYDTINTCINDDGCCPGTCDYLTDSDCHQCENNGDCDDSNSCTSDYCNASNLCENTVLSDNSSCDTGICCGGICGTPTCEDEWDCPGTDCYNSCSCGNPGTCQATCGTCISVSRQCGLADGCCVGDCETGDDPDCNCTHECAYNIYPQDVCQGDFQYICWHCDSQNCMDLCSPVDCSVGIAGNCPCSCGNYTVYDENDLEGFGCWDDLDNDCDGLTDCDDPDCAGQGSCP
ncbi:hypothetical protein K8R43_02410, partial [archaeon]|nr:hypothetical protein [archaeon]